MKPRVALLASTLPCAGALALALALPGAPGAGPAPPPAAHVAARPPPVEPLEREADARAPVRPRPIAGRVVAPDGAPIAGAEVSLASAAGAKVLARASADGSFRFEDLEPDPAARIKASAPGHAPRAFPLPREGRDELVLVLRPDQAP